MQTIPDLSLRLAATLAALSEKCKKITKCEEDDLKSKMEKKLAIVQHALTKLDSTCEYERTATA